MTTTVMKSLALALAVSAASAVSINAYTSAGCDGGPYGTCSDIPNNVCCGAIAGTTGATSGLFTDMPTDNRVLGYQQTRDGNACGSVVSDHVTSSPDVCITIGGGNQYSGFLWTYPPSKKARGVEARSSEGICTGSQAPDLLTFSNGTRVSLVGLEDAAVLALWELAVKEWSDFVVFSD